MPDHSPIKSLKVDFHDAKGVTKPEPKPVDPKKQLPEGVNPSGTLIEPDPALQQKAETTKLTPLEEVLFKNWAVANGIKDVDEPNNFYDYRGFFKHTNGQVHPPGSSEHFPDTFKQHGHPTFSHDSKYSKGPLDGGMYAGDTDFLPSTLGAPSISVGGQKGSVDSSDPIRELLNMMSKK